MDASTLVWPAAANATFPARIAAAGGLDALDLATRTAEEPGDLGVLDDVDAQAIGPAGEPPRDLVVARDAPAALQRAAEDRVSHVLARRSRWARTP